jgi:hypothetical protein
MQWSASIRITAPPAVVWHVLGEVEAWPQWTESVTEIVRVDPGPLHPGQRIRIRQPRLPATVWTLTDLAQQRYFVWRTGGPGVRTTAHHRIEQDGDGTLVTLRLTQHGPVGWLVGVLTASLTRRYLDMECTGLKRRCEET